jgi:hypothetical protein
MAYRDSAEDLLPKLLEAACRIGLLLTEIRDEMTKAERIKDERIDAISQSRRVREECIGRHGG